MVSKHIRRLYNLRARNYTNSEPIINGGNGPNSNHLGGDKVKHSAEESPWLQSFVRIGITLLSPSTARKGFIALADQAIVSATNFLTGVIIGRTLPKEQFGLYMLGFSIVLFLMNIQTALIISPYTVYSPRLEGNAHARYTGSTLIHLMALSALCTIVLIIAGAVLSFNIGPQGLAPVLWTLVGVIAFIMLREYVRQVCFANLRMKTALILDSCVSVIQIGGLILMVYTGILSASSAFLVSGAGCGIAALALIWVFSIQKFYTLSFTEAILDFSRNWSFARWGFAGALLYGASQQIYPWLLAGFHGTAATGVLSACMGALFLANPFLIGMGNFLGPKTAHAFANGGARELRRIVTKATIFYALTMGIFCVVAIFLGGWIVVLLYGNKYAGNGQIVGILALNQLASSLTHPAIYGLNAIERPDVGFASNLLPLGLTLTFGVWLVKSFDTVGVACGLLLGNVIGSAYRYIVFRKQLNTLSGPCLR